MTFDHPAWLMFFGALLLAVLPLRLRQVWQVALPVLSLAYVAGWMGGGGVSAETDSFLGVDTEPIRTGSINLLFLWLFHIAAIIAAIYALHLKDRVQIVSGMMYAAGALGVALAGDLLTLFVFWEILAITSVFQIWARKSKRSGSSGVRYLLMHVLSGLLLLAGAAWMHAKTGSVLLPEYGKPWTLDGGLGFWLIFLALGVKCAFPFLHTWLTDSYPEATPTGTVFLSAFTTKAAVCILAQTFAGTSLLIPIGTVMAMFPIFYAVIENDLRRVLGYSMINQIGFMVVGIGIGSELAINGAVAHAFNDVLFKGLLFMSMGAVLHRTGKINGSELGGLYKSMPITTVFCIIGAASISAFPLFSGFVSKSLVMNAVAVHQHDHPAMLIVWFCLLFAAAGVFHHAGIKIPFFAFFAHDSKIRCKEAPLNMLVAMGIGAFFCIFNGAFPNAWLYQQLPHTIADADQPYTTTHVITQTQLLFYSAMAFAVLMLTKIYPPELRSTNLDADWFYRKSGNVFYRVVDKSLNGLNAFWQQLFVGGVAESARRFFDDGASRILAILMIPIWRLSGISGEALVDKKQDLYKQGRRGAFRIGVTACFAVLLLALLILFSARSGGGE